MNEWTLNDIDYGRSIDERMMTLAEHLTPLERFQFIRWVAKQDIEKYERGVQEMDRMVAEMTHGTRP